MLYPLLHMFRCLSQLSIVEVTIILPIHRYKSRDSVQNMYQVPLMFIRRWKNKHGATQDLDFIDTTYHQFSWISGISGRCWFTQNVSPWWKKGFTGSGSHLHKQCYHQIHRSITHLFKGIFKNPKCLAISFSLVFRFRIESL